MGKVKLILVAAMSLCLSLALAGVASAAAINCGDCHGMPPVNGDNCANTARGLHGTHYNYSSATFKKTVASYGKCAYCHVNPPDSQPTATHNNGYTNITGYASGNIVSTGLHEDAGKNCTNACHRNRASSAKWGNYTATTVGNIVLTCAACHDDSSNNATSALSGQHKAHVLSNCTTAGTWGLMSVNLNAGCQNCHPDNRLDLWKNGKADDGTKKAYPHAVDGTNVVSANAVVQNNILTIAGSGSTATCTNNCHKNTATVTWGGTIACDACHYCAGNGTVATSDTNNNAAAVKLANSHSSHFSAAGGNIACTACHPNHSLDTDPGSHARNLVLSGTSLKATYLVAVNAGLGWSYAAGTCSSTGSNCHGSRPTPSFWTPGTVPMCAVCHNYPTAPAPNDWTGTNGHVVRYDAPVVKTHLKASGFNPSTDNYSTVTRTATGACYQCHKGATHRNGTIDTTAVGNSYCNVSNPFVFNVATTGTRVTCSQVLCHSGKKTPNWY